MALERTAARGRRSTSGALLQLPDRTSWLGGGVGDGGDRTPRRCPEGRGWLRGISDSLAQTALLHRGDRDKGKKVPKTEEATVSTLFTDLMSITLLLGAADWEMHTSLCF